MPRKKADEAIGVPRQVPSVHSPVVKKTRKVETVSSAAPVPAKGKVSRKKAAPVTDPASIAHLADAVEEPSVSVETQEIQELAYQSWIARGCPMGSPQEDWYNAERALIARFTGSTK